MTTTNKICTISYVKKQEIDIISDSSSPKSNSEEFQRIYFGNVGDSNKLSLETNKLISLKYSHQVIFVNNNDLVSPSTTVRPYKGNYHKK